MAYFVTGVFKDESDSGYYIYESISKTVEKVSSKVLSKNPHLIKNIKNVAVDSNEENKCILKGVDVRDRICEYSPAVVVGGREIKSRNTLVYLDLEENKYGVVNFDGTKVIWGDLGELRGKHEINNLCYERYTGKLHLSSYHIIKSDKRKDRDIRMEESIEEIKWLYDGSRNTKKELTLSKVKFYETIFMTLKDDDIITAPKWILKDLKFRLDRNLDVSMNLDKRVSLGTITLISYHDTKLRVIVRVDDNEDSIRMQIAMGYTHCKGKDYTVEGIVNRYNKWRANNKMLTI